MSARRARWLAWSLAAFAIALSIAGNVVALLGDAVTYDGYLIIVTILLAFTAVGALVAMRQPGNAIGWIFLGVGVATGFSDLVSGFVEYRLRSDPDPGALVGAAAAYVDVSWIPFVLIPATFLLLLFPDGRLPSPRWRFVAWCAASGILGYLFTDGAGPEPLADYPTVENPFAIDSPVMEALTWFSTLLLLVGMLGCALSVVVRYRRAGRLQRQQIKWLAAAGALVAVVFPTMLALYDTVGPLVADRTIMFTVTALPVAAGLAILRYRLYDIDIVINRALVYGALTATLAASYLGAVLLLQLALSPLTESSSLAIAVSTLAVAALFQPARHRIQATVDRRFYRRKYDAARTLERFGAHLRDEVDLDTLASELRVVVADTMQPAHVTLWLRNDT